MALHALGVPVQVVVAQLHPYSAEQAPEVVLSAHWVSVPVHVELSTQLQTRFAMHDPEVVKLAQGRAVPLHV